MSSVQYGRSNSSETKTPMTSSVISMAEFIEGSIYAAGGVEGHTSNNQATRDSYWDFSKIRIPVRIAGINPCPAAPDFYVRRRVEWI